MVIDARFGQNLGIAGAMNSHLSNSLKFVLNV
jgi:hypothetical protein